MSYFGLLHENGLLTDISDSPPTAEAGASVVALSAPPIYPPSFLLTYDPKTQTAIPHREFIDELQRRHVHRITAEQDAQWQECRKIQSIIIERPESVELQYPPDIISKLHDKLHANKWRTVQNLSRQTLRQLIDVAYFASQIKEEGHDISFTLALVNLEDASHMLSQRGWTPLPFAEPRPFSVSEIAKLAPTIDGSQSAIGVRNDGDKLLIWGVLLTDRSQYKLKRGESGTCAFYGPPHLRLLVPHRGRLIFEVFEKRLLEFQDGKIIAQYLPAFSEDGHVFRYLQSRKVSGDYPIRRPIHSLARRIMDSGHGGTLLVIDLEESHRISHCVLKYQMKKEVNIIRSLCQEIEMSESFRSALSLQDQISDKWRHLPHEISQKYVILNEVLDGVAKLAAVDGALAITTDLTLLSFGVRINCEKAANVYQANDLFAREIIPADMTSLGTRHNSGAAFASFYPRSMVFVASQDGIGTVFRRHGANVIMWRPVELDVLLDIDEAPPAASSESISSPAASQPK